LAPVPGTAIFLYGGRPFLTGEWQEARDRSPGMMIAMAIIVAYVASMASAPPVSPTPSRAVRGPDCSGNRGR
jgi:cation transport ATPase